MKLTVEVKEVIRFKNSVYYPDCENSTIFATLAGKKTLTNEALSNIEKLGFKVKIKKSD